MKRFLKVLLLNLIIGIFIAVLVPIKSVLATTLNKEMKIYSINIGNENRGDSTLIESNGEFLLMDIGVEGSYPYIDSFLSEKKITHFSLYFSHFHKDHTGGFNKEITEMPIYKLMQKYKIDHIYIQDPSLLQYKGNTIDENSDMYYRKLKKTYETSTNQDKNYDDIVVYLKEGSSFSFGTVNVSIIGPVGMDNYTSPTSNGTDEDGENAITLYQNNCSLVAKLVCGNISFLTAGDLKTDGERALINKYKGTSILKANIYKMSHHGLYPANMEEFLDCVKPDFSFASDYSYNTINTAGTGKYWRTYKAQMNCSKYGFTYMGGRENKGLQIDVINNNISLYRYGDSTKLNSEGWTKVVGGDGTIRTYDYYYFNKDGYTLKGVQKIDNKYYYLGTGGYRHYGRGKGKSYAGMNICKEDNKKRYYIENTDEMVTGFKQIKDASNYEGLYYFNKDGSLKTPSKNKTQKVKIGKYYYSMTASGYISVDVYKKYDGGLCYFKPSGRMATGWCKVDGTKYYFDKENGTRASGLTKIDDDYYLFNNYGKIVTTGGSRTINGVRYTFNKKGKMTNVPKAAKTSFSKLKSKNKSITLKWNKKSVAGYEIYMSTSKKGKYKKAKTIKKGSTTEATIKKLKKNTKYYVKIKSYIKIGKYKEYSKFSKVKKIKTKK